MNTPRPDLNLLVVLDAVLRAGSVTRAAEALSLSQPAVSHALNRLRRLTGDALFVRRGGRLVATPFAESLRERAAAIIEQAQAALASARFDPAATRRAFTIGVSDYAALTVAPQLMAALQETAPAARLDFRAIDGGVLEALASGTLDAAFWGADPPPSPLQWMELFRDSFVVVTAKGHPLSRGRHSGAAIRLDEYLAHPHIRVSMAGATPSTVDLALRNIGAERQIAVTVPGFASLLALLRHAPLIATAPGRLMRSGAVRDLATFPLPFETPPIRYGLIWHRRVSDDPAHRWLRAVAERTLAADGAG